MKGKNNMTVKEIKEKYVKGTKIRLIHMDDVQAPPDGTILTVKVVDDIGQIHVNESGLAVIPGEDEFEIIEGSEE